MASVQLSSVIISRNEIPPPSLPIRPAATSNLLAQDQMTPYPPGRDQQFHQPVLPPPSPLPDPAPPIVPTEGRRSKTRDDKHPIPPCLPTEAKKNRLPGCYRAALLLFSACSRGCQRQARPLKDARAKGAADIRWDHAADVDPNSRKKTWRLYRSHRRVWCWINGSSQGQSP